MDREKIWQHYFATGEVDPLVRSYQEAINGIAWFHFPLDKEDMAQWGMIGLLKAIRTIDPKRVKSKDAWVWMNVRGMMFNYHKEDWLMKEPRLEMQIGKQAFADLIVKEQYLCTRLDILAALKTDDPRGYLEAAGYAPSVRKDNETALKRYHSGELSLRGLATELGISRRQACKLVDKLPASW